MLGGAHDKGFLIHFSVSRLQCYSYKELEGRYLYGAMSHESFSIALKRLLPAEEYCASSVLVQEPEGQIRLFS